MLHCQFAKNLEKKIQPNTGSPNDKQNAGQLYSFWGEKSPPDFLKKHVMLNKSRIFLSILFFVTFTHSGILAVNQFHRTVPELRLDPFSLSCQDSYQSNEKLFFVVHEMKDVFLYYE